MHEAEQRKVVAQCKAEADVAEAKKRQSSRMTVNAHQTEAEVDINKKRQAEEDSKTALKLKMADNERTVKLREAEIQTEVGKREEEARAAALIQRAVEEQKVMKERTQQHSRTQAYEGGVFWYLPTGDGSGFSWCYRDDLGLLCPEAAQTTNMMVPYELLLR